MSVIIVLLALGCPALIVGRTRLNLKRLPDELKRKVFVSCVVTATFLGGLTMLGFVGYELVRAVARESGGPGSSEGLWWWWGCADGGCLERDWTNYLVLWVVALACALVVAAVAGELQSEYARARDRFGRAVEIRSALDRIRGRVDKLKTRAGVWAESAGAIQGMVVKDRDEPDEQEA